MLIEHVLAAGTAQELNSETKPDSPPLESCVLVRDPGLLSTQAPPGGSDGKESACNVGDLGSIPGLGRFPGGGHGNPLQYSCLEN